MRSSLFSLSIFTRKDLLFSLISDILSSCYQRINGEWIVELKEQRTEQEIVQQNNNPLPRDSPTQLCRSNSPKESNPWQPTKQPPFLPFSFSDFRFHEEGKGRNDCWIPFVTQIQSCLQRTFRTYNMSTKSSHLPSTSSTWLASTFDRTSALPKHHLSSCSLCLPTLHEYSKSHCPNFASS